jgi:hypothetical protein
VLLRFLGFGLAEVVGEVGFGDAPFGLLFLCDEVELGEFPDDVGLVYYFIVVVDALF